MSGSLKDQCGQHRGANQCDKEIKFRLLIYKLHINPKVLQLCGTPW